MPSILIVDDSPTAREALRIALSKEKDIEILAMVGSGREAVSLAARLRPDLITMDVHLRGENGLDVTREIMAKSARPILMITGVNPNDRDLAYRAMNAGALEVIGKLPASNHPDYSRCRGECIRLIRTLAKVPVVHRRKRAPSKAKRPHLGSSPPEQQRQTVATSSLNEEAPPLQGLPRVAIVGSSTGGPPLLEKLLCALPAPYPVPIVLVQHIAEGFAHGLAEWLTGSSKHRVQLVNRPLLLEPGGVYLAPDSACLEFTFGGGVRTRSPSPGEITPSISRALQTAAGVFGRDALGIILTGMGRDGQDGVRALMTAGAATIAQTPETCAVSSMPRAAIETGGVARVLSPPEIGDYLCSLVASGP